jgi:hypothetical protein
MTLKSHVSGIGVSGPFRSLIASIRYSDDPLSVVAGVMTCCILLAAFAFAVAKALRASVGQVSIHSTKLLKSRAFESRRPLWEAVN